ncbi:MAG: hypothetical protein B193_0023 [Solidesulfovibrio magneticus str. Maddingley MBC34]|uniref:Uncharacterized protein n=1 Tax=Solidesulfovibrio magneticus str. Maddingley MBC34 TaxID=1206767 RepID=K6GWJ9_9BACT|nr:MAG: hypothetical protein B193_0023 [Solidesulfovibrio magneticus str. Maddingley MBC34]
MPSIISNDEVLINNVLSKMSALATSEAINIAGSKDHGKAEIISLSFSYPFDDEILNLLRNKILPLENNEVLYERINIIKDIWFLLVEKSIKCLRYFDEREPYLKFTQKKPQAYGLDELKKYYEEFAGFEALLYSSNQFYRDHVIHLFRTWLIGLNILITDPGGVHFFNKISIEGDHLQTFTMNFFEIISVWTIASLCHDLGYPLEKFKEILHKTSKMMEFLVSNPSISQDIKFSGTQDKINEFIVKMISSKMKPVADNFYARTQSKYYIKYSKSLEDYSHGIISALIIYKSLLYFLESDFSTHDDHVFGTEDARQYYMRRDILRSIASHTCRDIYHMHSTSLPLLLIICDDLQEWGRKKWSDFYSNSSSTNINFSLLSYDENNISVEYTFEKAKMPDVEIYVDQFYKQFIKFKTLLRDGQDTEHRSFSFYIRYNITYGKKIINTTLLIPLDNAATFKVEGIGYKRRSEFIRILGKALIKRSVSFVTDYECCIS